MTLRFSVLVLKEMYQCMTLIADNVIITLITKCSFIIYPRGTSNDSPKQIIVCYR